MSLERFCQQGTVVFSGGRSQGWDTAGSTEFQLAPARCSDLDSKAFLSYLLLPLLNAVSERVAGCVGAVINPPHKEIISSFKLIPVVFHVPSLPLRSSQQHYKFSYLYMTTLLIIIWH